MFSVDFVSPSDYEHLAAEVSYRGQLLCIISKESGPGHLEVEFFHDSRILEADVSMKFPVADFIEVFKTCCEEVASLP